MVNFDVKCAIGPLVLVLSWQASVHFNLKRVCEKSTRPWSGRTCLQQSCVGVPRYWTHESCLPILYSITIC